MRPRSWIGATALMLTLTKIIGVSAFAAVPPRPGDALRSRCSRGVIPLQLVTRHQRRASKGHGDSNE